MFSILHDICENSVIHVELTCISSLVRQYTRTTNCSSFRMIYSDMFTVYGNDRMTKLVVISGHASQVFHADFFPRLVKYYVTPQPLNAWMNNNHVAIWRRCAAQAISRIGMYLKSLPVTNAIQSCSTFGKPWKWATASTTTSVSTVLITNDLKPESKLGMARHSPACSCPSVCPRLMFQTVLHVYIAGEIHALGFQRRWHPGVFQTRKSDLYSSTVFIWETETGRNQI